MKPLFALGLVFCAAVGCQTVHTSREGALPVAMWPSLAMMTREGTPRRSQNQEAVYFVLKEAGLHPLLNEGGVWVPDDEELRAREVLLTDKRLADSGVFVFLAVPAGSGTKTEIGFLLPSVAPHETMQITE